MKKRLNTILIILNSLILSGTIYYNNNYVLDQFDNLFNSIFANQKGASHQVIKSNLAIYIPIFIIVLAILFFLFSDSGIVTNNVDRFIKEESILKKLRNKTLNISNKALKIILIASSLYLILALRIIGFVSSNIQESDFYSKYYVNPKSVELTFPEKKKNLIHIYLESTETSIFSHINGGDFDESISKELQDLAFEGDNFSYNSGLGGFLHVPGATWTQAALIAQEAGINYKPLYTLDKEFDRGLPNITSIGDILKENNYNLKFLMGSDSDFADRRIFFEEHGYEIYDINSAREENKIPDDYNVWWGFEDLKLFEYAKEQILSLSKEDKPFTLNILTADTHFTDGYVDDSCALDYDVAYYNSYACSSKKVGEFVRWIKTQDFYKDTVIVITGDHLTMQDDVFDAENRYIYNTFLNTGKNANTKNRQATSLDIFPTVLSAMGVTIEGDRLALGVNLYSEEKTLMEILGREKLDEEIYKDSLIYWDITQTKERKKDE